MPWWQRRILAGIWLVLTAFGASLFLRDRLAGAAILSMFGLGLAGGVLAPLLTRKRIAGATLGTVRLGSSPEPALLFPFSRRKQLLHATSTLGFGCGVLAILAHDQAGRTWPAGFQPGLLIALGAVVLCLGIALLLTWYAAFGRQAIALTPDQIVQLSPWGWAAAPWSRVCAVTVFGLHVQFGTLSFLGIALEDRHALRRSRARLPWVPRVALAWLRRLRRLGAGYDLAISCDAFEAPHDLVANVCQHFLAHPEHRPLLGTAESLRLVEHLAVVSPR